ncbi:MAG: pyridoxal phosphate-dependent aminotransferase family protein, partial [Bacteroidales bacterium]|nr:pyridoxal phosphate-dependent aminotransferase family protein [Bacteroidales bacterium]
MFPRLEGPISNRMMFNGKERLVWSLNNYLGLANHPEVRKVDAEAAAQYGLAYPMGARMLSGQTEEHMKLEQGLADFVGQEAAYLYNFGYQGIVSTIDALVDRHDVIVFDAEIHASLMDGKRLHLGQSFKFRHNDMEDAERMIKKAQEVVAKTGGGILVITEGVYGMTGEAGNVGGLAELKKKYDFRLMVDDAHGVGVMGP